MKTVKVAAAVVFNDDMTEVLAAQRGYGDFKGGWEFPGGKIEAGETPEAALKREIMEEMNVDVKVGDLLEQVEYDYDTFHLSMACFACRFSSVPELKEHLAVKWLKKAEVSSVNWLPADLSVIDRLKEIMK